MLNVDEIKIGTMGRWRHILSELGVRVREDGKHEPCPLCGGKDRFRMDDKDSRGTWFCNQCGAGDGFRLVEKAFQTDFIGAAKLVSRVLGHCGADRQQVKKNGDNKAALVKLWKKSAPYSGTGIIKEYLASRGIKIIPNDLRHCESCYESQTQLNLPAMLAVVRGFSGKVIGLHRTYLDGPKKADIKCPKKLMTPIDKINNGAAIRLIPSDNTGMLAVSEGIETALSVYQLTNIPTWSLINTTVMESFIPPDGIKSVLIYADNDSNYAGHKAAYILANKLELKGISTVVRVPDRVDTDWNDFLIGRR